MRNFLISPDQNYSFFLCRYRKSTNFISFVMFLLHKNRVFRLLDVFAVNNIFQSTITNLDLIAFPLLFKNCLIFSRALDLSMSLFTAF